MTGVTETLLVVLGLALPPHVPDLQVEAVTAAGGELPELTDAVARALVASGAHVVLRSPTSGPCLYCATVKVVETRGSQCRVEVSQDRHGESALLQFPPGSPLLDRARAIAIQARMLVTWDTGAEARGRDGPPRPVARKPERRPERTTAEEVEARGESSAPTGEPDQGTRPVADVERAPTPVPVASGPDHGVAGGSPAGEKATPHLEPKPALVQPAAAKTPPPSAPIVHSTVAAKPWPWIPLAIGASAATAAGICALVARDRYDALADKSQPYASAVVLKDQGENWQTASYVLAGVAAVGVATGVLGFATRPAVTPVPGGAVVALTGDLP
jgi:hypothetical protein